MAQTTKRALEASLKKLLLRKPLNKITINDITEDCGVNRMTFYYHFKDIYDLVDWILVEDATEALEGHQDYETWSDAFRDMLEKGAGQPGAGAQRLPLGKQGTGGAVPL